MLLLTPIAILVLTLLALAASNLQRGFRSSWLVALIGSSLAMVSLLFLRLQLPLTLMTVAWRIGAGLEYTANFALDEISWPLAFMVCSLCVAAILGQARHAVGAAWHSWAPSLVATAATILTALSADLLTLLFSWTLLDILVFVLLLLHVGQAEPRKELLSGFILNLASSFLLLAAWTLSFYGDELIGSMVIVAITIRIGLAAPRLRLTQIEKLRGDFSTTLMLIPIAASFPFLAGMVVLPEPTQSVLLLFILIAGLYVSMKSLFEPAETHKMRWEVGMAALAVAAGIGGQPLAVVTFSLMGLAGTAINVLVQSLPKFRNPAAIAAALVFLGLPFTASQRSLALFGSASSPLIFVFLLVHGALLAGWLRRAMQPRSTSLPPEPWMRSVEWLSLGLVPLIYVVLGIGLLPVFTASEQPPLWPIAIVGLVSIAQFLVAPRLAQTVPARFHALIEQFFSLQWLQIAVRLVSRGVSNVLGFANLLLEGQAGVLWAMLLMALLISLAAQFGLGG